MVVAHLLSAVPLCNCRARGLPSVENKVVSLLFFSAVLVGWIVAMHIPVRRREEKRANPVGRGGPMSRLLLALVH